MASFHVLLTCGCAVPECGWYGEVNRVGGCWRSCWVCGEELQIRRGKTEPIVQYGAPVLFSASLQRMLMVLVDALGADASTERVALRSMESGALAREKRGRMGKTGKRGVVLACEWCGTPNLF
ncbi:hypothetical protein EGR_09530 [Echinococcus granulosus]|uniref:Uncharacterized protein n=1 Tax=Echinococcus granulosus TaxID=6210 RepID=W6U3A5_ECHGR|nr:hypothetical protein EGR_09530 [Echinococcus granulosus]EUB55590.1 hypothetical protein EGR_09530 [Echinococcus granulosus]